MPAKVAACPRPALTPHCFRIWIKDRLSAGESKTAIGRSLGVTGAGVSRWLTNRCNVSDTVLLLAELLRRAPVDLAPGLPVGSVDAGG